MTGIHVHRSHILLFLAFLLTFPFLLPALEERKFDPKTVIDKPFPPLVDVPHITARKVSNQVSDEELVLGVVIGKQARAYPINMLTQPTREIINDKLGGRRIAATW